MNLMEHENSTNENNVEPTYMNPMQHISAGTYDRFTALLMMGRQKGIRISSINLAGIQMGDNVLEIGCGTGTLTILAKASAGPEGKVVGIDPLPQLIQGARKKAKKAKLDITFQAGLMEDIPFPDASFEVVLASFMIFHTDGAIRQKGFDEVHRVLKPGGKFLVVDTQIPSQGTKVTLADKLAIRLAGSAMFDNSLESLRPLLEASGFQSVQAGTMKYAIIGYMLSIK